jgi:hypothetical protein
MFTALKQSSLFKRTKSNFAARLPLVRVRADLTEKDRKTRLVRRIDEVTWRILNESRVETKWKEEWNVERRE